MQQAEAPTVKWGEWIGEGWQMFAEQWQQWVLLMLVFIVLIAVPVVPLYLFIIGAQLATVNEPSAEPPTAIFLLMPLIYIVILGGSSFLMAGCYRAAFKQLRGGTIAVSDLFSGGDVFWKVLGGFLLVAILSMIAAVFCILPALVVAGLFAYTQPLIIEGRLGVIDAMKASFDRTKGSWFMFTLFVLVVSLLAQIGSVACGVGLLATFPLLFTIQTVAYRDLFGVSGARHFLDRPVPPPSAYSATFSQPGATPPSGHCPRCGANIVPTAKFCNICGSSLQG
jgi:hypothetical protein